MMKTLLTPGYPDWPAEWNAYAAGRLDDAFPVGVKVSFMSMARWHAGALAPDGSDPPAEGWVVLTTRVKGARRDCEIHEYSYPDTPDEAMRAAIALRLDGMPREEIEWLAAYTVGKLVAEGWREALWGFLTAVTPQEIARDEEYRRRRALGQPGDAT